MQDRLRRCEVKKLRKITICIVLEYVLAMCSIFLYYGPGGPIKEFAMVLGAIVAVSTIPTLLYYAGSYTIDDKTRKKIDERMHREALVYYLIGLANREEELDDLE
jgi:hypothetical protein